MGENDYPWWKETTVYQIYPRSFLDSDGDGVGNLEGVISKLDYIRDLGFETIWFSPFYPSPQRDFGYDITDFTDIHPEYGSLEIFDTLVEEMHARGMKIVLDMVLNHTSDQHPWFLESRSSRDNPKRDWYVWRDGRSPRGKKPPNNWKSKVTGSGWHYDPQTDQWYWAAFLPCQPDLNFRNPRVREAIIDAVRFWLDRGADGMRLDIIGSLFEDEEFRDNPFILKFLPSADDPDKLFQSTVMTEHHPDTFDFIKRLREVVDEYSSPPRFMVGEAFGGIETLRRYCGGEKNDGLHTVFLFQTLNRKMQAGEFRGLIEEFERGFPEPLVPTWVFSNHDRYRWISVHGNDPAKAKLTAALLFTVRGIPYTYYGEEIGMLQHERDPDMALDGVTEQFSHLPNFLIRVMQRASGGSVIRDGARTPMQWSGGANAGFCPGAVSPWLPIHPFFETINVEYETNLPGSVLSCYRKFLHLRNKEISLRRGNLELIDAKDLPKTVLGYRRTYSEAAGDEHRTLTVYLNFSYGSAEVPLDKGSKPLTSTEPSPGAKGDTLLLRPWEGVVVGKAG
jgi:oligo-1,6-glucosidase/alpha-glucosidase